MFCYIRCFVWSVNNNRHRDPTELNDAAIWRITRMLRLGYAPLFYAMPTFPLLFKTVLVIFSRPYHRFEYLSPQSYFPKFSCALFASHAYYVSCFIFIYSSILIIFGCCSLKFMKIYITYFNTFYSILL
jgi:hypothetical protein